MAQGGLDDLAEKLNHHSDLCSQVTDVYDKLDLRELIRLVRKQ